MRKDRPHQLPAGDQRDRATDQPPHRAELHPPPPADVARRSGAPVGSAAQHRLGHRRSADRRGLGHRRRRRALAARTASAQPASERRARRHSRRRAAARDDDHRPGRRGRALHGAGDVCDGRDARTVRRGSGRRHQRAAARASARAVRRHGRQPARPRRRQRPTGVRAEPGLGTGAAHADDRGRGGAAGERRERRQRVRAGRTLVRPPPRAHPPHRGGDGVGRHRRRAAAQRTAGARRRVDGRRVRPREPGRRWPALPLRAPRLLGTLRVELGGRAALPGAAGARRRWRARATSMRLEDLARLAESGDRGGRRLAGSDGPLPGHGAGEPGDGPGARRHRRRRRSHRHLGSHRPHRRRADGGARAPQHRRRASWPPTPRRSRACAAR